MEANSLNLKIKRLENEVKAYQEVIQEKDKEISFLRHKLDDQRIPYSHYKDFKQLNEVLDPKKYKICHDKSSQTRPVEVKEEDERVPKHPPSEPSLKTIITDKGQSESSLPFLCCTSDSPVARLKIQSLIEQVESIHAKFSGILSAFDRVCECHLKLAEAMSTFGSLMCSAEKHAQSMKDDDNPITQLMFNPFLMSTLSAFGGLVLELGSSQTMTSQVLSDALATPLRKFLNVDCAKITQSIKSVDNHTKYYEDDLAKYLHSLQPCKKPSSAETRNRLESIKQDSLRQLELSRFDLVHQLNMVLFLVAVDVPQRFLSALVGLRSHYHLAHVIFTDPDRSIRDHMEQLQQIQESFSEHQHQTQTLRIKLSQSISSGSADDEWRSLMPLEPLLPEGRLLSEDPRACGGYLWKRSSGSVRKGWQRRYFFIYQQAIWYWSHKEKSSFKISDIAVCNVRPSIPKDFSEKAIPAVESPLIFQLTTPEGRVYFLQAESEAEYEKWMTAINDSIRVALQGPQVTLTSPGGSTRRMAPGLRSMMESNCFCADCGDKNPSWAVINWGVLVCDECAGCHRHLGVAVSKVRSVSLDLWNPIHVDIMRQLGNEVVNSFLEYQFLSGWKKPEPTCCREMRQSFIEAKYKWKGFSKTLVDNKKSRRSSISTARIDNAALAEKLTLSALDAISKNDLPRLLEAITMGVNVSRPSFTTQVSPLQQAVESDSVFATELLSLHGAQNVPDIGSSLSSEAMLRSMDLSDCCGANAINSDSNHSSNPNPMCR